MILTGSEIVKERDSGNIILVPFSIDMINPNSYNYHLGCQLKKFVRFSNGVAEFEILNIPRSGYVLSPGTMYLGNTLEVIGSQKYAMSLIGRSSIGRLGLFVQVSADLGHTTCSHQWTLELVASKAIRIYPYMKIGQVSFWSNKGNISIYTGNHGLYSGPQESLLE